jgi:hypothetical protein
MKEVSSTPSYIPSQDVNYYEHSWVWNPVGRTHDLKAFPAINTPLPNFFDL